jgi:hypothetical protein
VFVEGDDSEIIKIFLSYSTADKVETGNIRGFLMDFGFKVFLAHHDITPSDKWIEEITNSLDKCDIFIPYLTENGMDSFWVNQEIGIAYSKNKIIFPLKKSKNPWGFIAGTQAHQLKIDSYSNLRISIEKAAEILINKYSKEENKIKKTLIPALKNAPNFNTSNIMAKILIKIENYSTAEINEIVKNFLENRQVREATDMQPLIQRFFQKNQGQISKKYLESLKETLEN